MLLTDSTNISIETKRVESSSPLSFASHGNARY